MPSRMSRRDFEGGGFRAYLPVLLLLLVSNAWAQGADFNADGRVDADDFFARLQAVRRQIAGDGVFPHPPPASRSDPHPP